MMSIASDLKNVLSTGQASSTQVLTAIEACNKYQQLVRDGIIKNEERVTDSLHISKIPRDFRNQRSSYTLCSAKCR